MCLVFWFVYWFCFGCLLIYLVGCLGLYWCLCFDWFALFVVFGWFVWIFTCVILVGGLVWVFGLVVVFFVTFCCLVRLLRTRFGLFF